MSRSLVTPMRRSATMMQQAGPRTWLPRRYQSTTAAEAAESLLSRFAGKTRTVSQVLDGNQLQKLSLTLMRRSIWPGLDISEKAPPVGTVLPPGYHLCYFTPGGLEEELGADGTDSVYNAPKPFSRRMWAGGRMRWEKEGLRVGDLVEERTQLVSAVPKKSRDGSEMVLVGVEKQFWGPKGLALVDERSWIFRPEASIASPAAEKTLKDSVLTTPSKVSDVQRTHEYPLRNMQWSMTALFRFSALTFNAHKIHVDPTWTTAVENHKGCVVHGPLNLINMLDYWRDHCAGSERRAKEISYRAVAPLYVGEQYSISAQKKEVEADSWWSVLVGNKDKACMHGEIQGMKV